jgi:LuxR family maltose regulon positive regulatory protein
VPADAYAFLESDLLATKVAVPRVRPDLLARPDLAARIDAATAHDLCLVCSPPGFGKTTLLAAWAAASERAVAWLALDGGDNDPVRFWRYAIAALRQVRPGLGQPASALLAKPGDVPVDAVVTALINELTARDDDLTLVLDDYHAVSSPAVHDGVAFLLGHLPPCLRLVIAGRSDPPLPLGELRAGGRLAELRAADLRFSAAEAAAFLRDLWGLALPDDAVAALAGRTEGWVAGSSWRRSPCATSRTRRRSSRRSPAATASSSTTSARRCWRASPRRRAASCSPPRCWSASPVRSATR